MKITLLGATILRELPDSVRGTDFTDVWYSSEDNDADTLGHFAGRSCYQSWHMPNEATSTNEGYIENIINQGHFSVLEHASATFYVEGVSRNLTHELIRHRHLSYSELSQRYVNMEDAKIVIPPVVDALSAGWLESATRFGRAMGSSLSNYSAVVDTLHHAGVKGKKAREAARGLLPGGTETKIVVSGNHRAWRDMLHKRYSVHADAEMQLFATKILTELRKLAPATYQDFPDSPFE